MVFLIGTLIVFSSVPETMAFLIELLMSLFYQQNSLIGTQRSKSPGIFNDFKFTE